MGYTHYWTQKRDLTTDEMGDFSSVVRRIIAASTVPICGGNGTGKPTLNKNIVSLNGQGPNDDHESFVIRQKIEPDAWEFCKTARKPYDAVVIASLTVLAADYGFEVASDGDVDEWEEGVTLAEAATGRQFANPLIVKQLVE